MTESSCVCVVDEMGEMNANVLQDEKQLRASDWAMIQSLQEQLRQAVNTNAMPSSSASPAALVRTISTTSTAQVAIS